MPDSSDNPFQKYSKGNPFAKYAQPAAGASDADPPGALSAFWEGAKQGFPDMVYGAGQLGARALSPLSPGMPGRVDAAAAARERAYQGNPAVQAHPIAAGAGRFAGNAATIAPAMMLPPGAGLAARLGIGAGMGAAAGALQPGPMADRPGQMIAGAAAGGALPGLGGAFARPMTGAAGQLAARGVPLNPGASMGGLAQRAELAVRNFPFIGALVRGGEERSMHGFNRATVNEVLAPVRDLLPPEMAQAPRNMQAGHDMMNFLTDAKDEAFRRAYVDVFFREDAQFTTETSRLRDLVQELPSGSEQKAFEHLFDRVVTKRLGGNPPNMDGQTLQQTLRDIDRFVEANKRSNEGLADAGRELAREIRDSLVRQNPQAAERLRNVNKMFAMFATVRRAAVRRDSSEAVFTPTDLSIASRVNDRSAGKGDFMRGNALLQNFAEIGKKVLEPKGVPTSHMGLLSRLADFAGGAAASVPYRLLQRTQPGSMPYELGRQAGRMAAPAGTAAAEQVSIAGP